MNNNSNIEKITLTIKGHQRNCCRDKTTGKFIKCPYNVLDIVKEVAPYIVGSTFLIGFGALLSKYINKDRN